MTRAGRSTAVASCTTAIATAASASGSTTGRTAVVAIVVIAATSSGTASSAVVAVDACSTVAGRGLAVDRTDRLSCANHTCIFPRH